MHEIVSIFLIGVSLSMDTFSLSLSIGSIIKKSPFVKILPFLVGIFHFFMPLFGNLLGLQLVEVFNIATNIILGLVLIFLGINLAIHYFKDEDVTINLNIIGSLFFALSVSIDSFSVGLGISDITNNYLMAYFIFAVCSSSFTALGLIIGKYSNKYIGKTAIILGILLLLVLGIFHLLY